MQTTISRFAYSATLRNGAFMADVDWNPNLISAPSITFYRVLCDQGPGGQSYRQRLSSICGIRATPDELIAQAKADIEEREHSRQVFACIP